MKWPCSNLLLIISTTWLVMKKWMAKCGCIKKYLDEISINWCIMFVFKADKLRRHVCNSCLWSGCTRTTTNCCSSICCASQKWICLNATCLLVVSYWGQSLRYSTIQLRWTWLEVRGTINANVSDGHAEARPENAMFPLVEPDISFVHVLR